MREWSCAIETHRCRIKGFESTAVQSYRLMQFGQFLLSNDKNQGAASFCMVNEGNLGAANQRVILGDRHQAIVPSPW